MFSADDTPDEGLATRVRKFMLATLCMASACQCAAADWEAEILRGDALARSGKAAEAKRIMDSMSADRDGKQFAPLLAVRMQIALGKPEVAAAQLAKAFPSEDSVEAASNDLQLAYAKTLLSLKRWDEAAAVANRLGAEAGGMPRCKAAELMSDIFAGRQRWQDALDWVQMAIKTLESFKYTEEEKAYLGYLHAKRNKIAQVMELLTHGLGFRLYRMGNESRFAKRHAEAVATYDKIALLYEKNKGKPIPEITGIDDPKIYDFPIHDLYAAAAAVYRGQCLIAQEKYGEAAKGLAATSLDDSNPYRGEALRLLGDAALEGSGDTDAALRHYGDAIRVLGDDNRSARSLDRFRVPNASRAVTKAPAKMRAYKGWGNLEWFQPEPSQVVNAETCEWYTGYQLMLAKVQRSLCYFLAGKTDAAVADLDIILAVDEDDKALTERNLPSNYLRLRDGYRKGRLYATPAELAEFKGRNLVRLVRAEVLFETEQWNSALEAYGKLADDEAAKLSKGAKAYLDYARGCALDFAGKPKDAQKFAKDFSGPKSTLKDTPSYWRAQFLLGNLSPKDEIRILSAGADLCPDGSLRVDFVLRIGQLHFVAQRYDEAGKAFATVRSLAAADDYRQRAAGQYLELIRQKSVTTTKAQEK